MPEDISFLLLPGFSAIGFMSAVEPLRVANRFRENLYRWHILSVDGAPVAASNGISLNAEAAFDAVDHAQTVFIVAGFDPLACYNRALAGWLRRLAQAGATLGGIDTGSFVLAEASKVAYADQLKAAGYPEITTEIAAAGPFYYAEDYHQQYLDKNPDGYCGLGSTGVSCPIGLMNVAE